jgi:hypothetical protein
VGVFTLFDAYGFPPVLSVEEAAATTRLHSATHLLYTALRLVLDDHVVQRGSNITAERLRFDFSHPAKMTPEIAQSGASGPFSNGARSSKMMPNEPLTVVGRRSHRVRRPRAAPEHRTRRTDDGLSLLTRGQNLFQRPHGLTAGSERRRGGQPE